jgi:phosphoribosylcarboxyaminoimidazole (NCAIR) mutase
MGTANDWVQQSARALQDFGVAYDARVISAHLLFDYIKECPRKVCSVSSRARAARHIWLV